jgi:hypothetical protein
MAFVPEGQHDRSLARSARVGVWKFAESLSVGGVASLANGLGELNLVETTG